MQELKADILKRANRMLSLCQNADQFANQTMMTLGDQHERLVNVQTHLLSMNTTLIETKKDVNRLKGMTKRVAEIFRIKSHRKIQVPKQVSSPKRRPMPVKSMPGSDPIIDKQIDQTLYQITHWIRSLKDQAYIINDELVRQAETVDRIQQHMEESTDRIQEQSFDIKKINSGDILNAMK